MFATFIAEYDHAVVIISFVKLKSSEIYPSASAYLLVDFKLSDASIMKNKVFGITHTIG